MAPETGSCRRVTTSFSNFRFLKSISTIEVRYRYLIGNDNGKKVNREIGFGSEDLIVAGSDINERSFVEGAIEERYDRQAAGLAVLKIIDLTLIRTDSRSGAFDPEIGVPSSNGDVE